MTNLERMPESSSLSTRWLVLVIIFLASVYMLTYSGRIESTDTLFLFDAAESLLRFGDSKLDLSSGVRPPIPQHIQAGEFYPLSDVNAERLQSLLAAPLYALASALPGIGLVHAVYLFNVVVSALAGGVIFLYARTLGYDQRTATLGALVFGLGTIIWPYSKTFFLEPLTLLFILLAALLLHRWRKSRYRAFPLLIGALGCVAAALLTKTSTFLALPGLVLIALPAPPPRWERAALRAAIILSLLIVISAAALVFAGNRSVGRWFDLTFDFSNQAGRYMRVALHSYLFSIGGSVWGTSPVILLAIPGAWLMRARQRYTLVMIVMIGTFALVYALRQGPAWFGGLSWPPRFLVPVVPFAVLCALPVLERVRHGSRNFMLIFGTLFAYSVWIQISGISLWWGDYASALPPESNQLSEWGGGLNDVRYLRWVIIPGLWSHKPPDFAWVRTGAPVWAAGFALLAIASGTLLWLRTRRAGRLTVILPLVFVALSYLGLRAIYDDDFYLSSNDNLHAVIPIIEANTQPGDVLLLADLTYRDFFANYGKLTSARVVSLPFHPGEQPSPEQPPEVRSDNPDVLIHQTAAPLIHALAQTRERLWLLASSSSFIPWSVRPAERFMAAHYFPVREFAVSADVRLIEYSTVDAPDPYAFYSPVYLTDLLYGGTLQLAGYDLPLGTVYAPGDVLPVSLYWRAESVVEGNYKISLSLRALDGFPKAQAMDTAPAGDLSPTSAWTPGTAIWDNRAMRLPPDLAPGEYQLWVIVYHNPTDGIDNLPAEGEGVLDGFIGVLPTRVTIR